MEHDDCYVRGRAATGTASKLAPHISVMAVDAPLRDRRGGLGSGDAPVSRSLQQILDQVPSRWTAPEPGRSAVRGADAVRLADGFPLLTTKKLHLRSIIVELLWFLRGDTNIAWLKERKVGIWDEWADDNGDLGPVYGKQWRDWQAADGRHIDQIAGLVEQIRTDPGSRRQIVTAWNPGNFPAGDGTAPAIACSRPRSLPGS